MIPNVTIRALTADEAKNHIRALSDVLIDCVEGGASVSFMAPLAQERANAFWWEVADSVAAGRRLLLVAQEPSDGRIVGTVQVVFAQQENQPHRADLAKMLVLRQARRRGIGAALMQEAEAAAREAGKTLLVLDTTPGGPAERLYERLGWTKVGVIASYALWPDGGFCDTTIFFKQISPA